MKFSLKRESFLLFSNNYSHDIDYSLLYSNRIYLKNSTKQNWDHCKLHLECLSNLHSTIHSLIVKVYSIQINKKNISYKRTTIEQIKWKQFKHLLLPFFSSSLFLTFSWFFSIFHSQFLLFLSIKSFSIDYYVLQRSQESIHPWVSPSPHSNPYFLLSIVQKRNDRNIFVQKKKIQDIRLCDWIHPPFHRRSNTVKKSQ